MNNKVNILGLCARARKIVTGEELVLAAIRSNKAKLVFIASDAGEVAKKNVKDKSAYYKVDVDDTLTTVELSQAIGMNNRKVVAILDEGFAKILKK